jgi:Phosphotransferase enzyme family
MGVTSAATPVTRPPEPQLATSVAMALGCDPAAVTIVRRYINVHTSTWPSEIVDCRLAGGRALRLLVKHGPCGVRNAHGHPVGPEYEAAVYESVLRGLGLAHPFRGARRDPGSQSVTIVLDYLEDGWWRLNRVADPRTIVEVAAWIGAFHRDTGARAGAQAGLLNVYDSPYYAGWARRSLRYLAHIPADFGWLRDVCGSFEHLGRGLAAGPLTVVHGELYPQNVLVRGDAIRPLDWEWAGIAAGEVDLAALTEGWSAELTEASERAYADARWPGGGGPRDFARRLDVARVYMHLRWLADRTDRVEAPELRARLEDLRLVAQRLGISG